MKIILGSKSKGRKKILEEMGFQFEVKTANIDEKTIRFEDPKELTLALARAKAEALKPQISEPAILITSDQVVVWEGKIREKPENEKEVKEFLEGYELFPAETVTAVVVTNIETGKQAEGIDIAKVYFHPFSKEDVDELIKEGSVFHLFTSHSTNALCMVEWGNVEETNKINKQSNQRAEAVHFWPFNFRQRSQKSPSDSAFRQRRETQDYSGVHRLPEEVCF